VKHRTSLIRTAQMNRRSGKFSGVREKHDRLQENFSEKLTAVSLPAPVPILGRGWKKSKTVSYVGIRGQKGVL